MRFLTRSLLGVFLAALSLGLLAMAVSNVYRGLEARQADQSRGRPAQERLFPVNVDTLALAPATPVITAFGEASSRRTLEIRTAAPGRIVELAEAFRDGGRVAAGDVLVRIDPADAGSALDLARAELAEARAQRVEAETTLELARIDLQGAEQTRTLRMSAMVRQQDLRARGAGTRAAEEDAEISLSSADQAVVSRRQALAQAEAQLERTAITVERREIAVREAERTLADTTVTAPFGGLLTAADASAGAIMASNERIGTLIDPAALEVAFRVTNAQFTRLLDAEGRLTLQEVRVALPLAEFPIVATGRLDRAGAEVGDGQTGRLLYAALDPGSATALRPGDFLTVEIAEPELADVAVIPAVAADPSGEILLLAEDDRLEAHPARILRRQGDDLIVADVPAGREYVRERVPQLGAGVKVRPIRPDAEMAAPELVALTDAERARLVAAVEANTQIPAEARARVLDRLAQDRVPKSLIDRLAPQAPRETAETTLVLEPERRARLIAFVEGNARMSAEVKERLLGQLNGETVPVAVVERLEGRMGG
ncbi:MAG: HlyD family efflux transporter periplasmic adaptor subunit [Pseudomonadota bacterium]